MHQQINLIISFLKMGGYGGYIWPAYVAMLILFGLCLLLPARQHQRIKAKLRG